MAVESEAPLGRGGDGRATDKTSGALDRETRLSLRHEAELGKLRSDTGFMMFMDTPTANPELGVIPGLRKVAAEWSAKFQEKAVTSPLRIILMMALIREMMTRLENFMKDPVKCARAEEIGWMSQGHNALEPVWHYWGWDPKEKKPIKLDQQPLPLIQAQLQVLEKAVPLQKQQGFGAGSGLRASESHAAHRAMTLLSENAVCKLMA